MEASRGIHRKRPSIVADEYRPKWHWQGLKRERHPRDAATEGLVNARDLSPGGFARISSNLVPVVLLFS
jgi:hypothetical protein